MYFGSGRRHKANKDYLEEIGNEVRIKPGEWSSCIENIRKIRTEKSTKFGNMNMTGDPDLRSVKREMQTETGVECNEEGL